MDRKGKLYPLGDEKYDYYKLTKSLGYNNGEYGIKDYILPQGSIFVHDKDDNIHGSAWDGCLTLCWNSEGNCQGWICGGCLHLHSSFRNTDLFEKIDDNTNKLKQLIGKLEKELQDAKEELSKISQ